MGKTSERGQVLLIIVLVLVVSLTVGLALVSRSITNLRTSTEEENSQRALSAAEAGIEQVLKSGVATGNKTFTANNTSYSAVISQLSGQEFLFNSGNPIPKDEGVDIWLVDHRVDGSADYASGWQTLSSTAYTTIFWGNANDTCTNSAATNTMAAVEIVAIVGTEASPQMVRYVYDPCTTGRTAVNSFCPVGGVVSATCPLTSSTVGGTIGTTAFHYAATVSFPITAKALLMRIISLYSRTPIGIAACDNLGANCNSLPSQGKRIESTGFAGPNSEIARKVVFFQGYPALPVEFFPHIVFSPK